MDRRGKGCYSLSMASHSSTPRYNRFKAWMDRHGMSVSEAATALGVAKRTIVNWRKTEPPTPILLACAAYSMGVKPIE